MCTANAHRSLSSEHLIFFLLALPLVVKPEHFWGTAAVHTPQMPCTTTWNLSPVLWEGRGDGHCSRPTSALAHPAGLEEAEGAAEMLS